MSEEFIQREISLEPDNSMLEDFERDCKEAFEELKKDSHLELDYDADD